MNVYRFGNRSEKIRINTLHDYLKTIFIDLFKMIICIINGANIIKVGISVHGEMRLLKRST